MPTNIASLWAHAQQLPQNTEEASRTKISRAYYALYHHALVFHDELEVKGLLPANGGGVHKTLIHQLVNPTVKKDAVDSASRSLGTFLGLARELREQADYHPENCIDTAQVSKCLRYVRIGLTVQNPDKVAKAG